MLVKKLRIKKYSLGLLLLLTTTKIFSSEMTVGYYLEMRSKDKSSRDSVENYVSGMGQGILFASIYSSSVLKNKPIVCPPQNLKITGNTALDILDDAIKKSPISLSSFPVAVVLTDSFAKKYPCIK
jgi:hypothetical protein